MQISKKKAITLSIIVGFIIGTLLTLAIMYIAPNSMSNNIVLFIVALSVGVAITTYFNDRHFNNQRTLLIIILIASFVVGSCTGIGINIGLNKRNITKELDMSKKDVVSKYRGITTYTLDHKVLKNKDAENTATKIKDIVNYASTNDSLVYVAGGTEDTVYIYNKKGEVFEQTESGTMTTVYRDDGLSIRHIPADASLVSGLDEDILTLLDNALSGVIDKTAGVQLFEMTLGEDEPKTAHEYRLDLIGDDALKKCYESLGKDFQEDMIINIRSQINDETWQPHLIYTFYLDDNKPNTIEVNSLLVQDDTEKLIWQIGGIKYLDADWELPKEWYDTEGLNNLADSGEELTERTINQIQEIVLGSEYDNNEAPEQSIFAPISGNNMLNNSLSLNNLNDLNE